MLDAIGRWFGAPAVTPESKAATGPGVFAMSTYLQVHSLSRHPAKLMAEAQVLFHLNPWVKRAEQTIFGRYAKAAWHLEDSAGNTVDAKSSGPAKVAYDLIANPNPDQSRRALWSLTMRHQGLCGNGFWYLDQRLVGGGPPTQIIYINPARMTPVQTAAGKLLGWVMDDPQNPVSQSKNLRNAAPFEIDELRHFKLDEPDWDHYGIGIAEAANDQVQLEEIATRHASSVLSSGGRIAGLISPKPNITMNDEQWAALVRDWRNIASDPDAAKRLLIVKGPVDFTNTAANFSELEMSGLLTLSRDNIFAAWGIPLSQGPGIVVASGLNSGEAQKYEEAALWQGPIDLRAGPFEEQVQSVLDMFELGLRLVVESPAFDDQAPLFLNAEKATKQPLTNNERRALLGFDPLEDDELGKAIYVEQTMTRIDAEPETPPQLLPFTGGPSEENAIPNESGMADAVKADLRATWDARLRGPLNEFLARQASAIANRIKNNHVHITSRPSDVRTWWNERQWDRELGELLEPLMAEMAGKVARRTAKPLVRPAKADNFLERVLALVRRSVGLRITGINQTTRDSVARLVAAGIEQGLSPADLAQTIRDGAAFNEARAELISRTETGTVYNQAAIETFRDYEVAHVEVIDGDHDAECTAANGATWTLDEALGNPLGHPNCVRDFIPVVAAKAELAAPTISLPQINLTLQAELPPYPEIYIPPTQVTVNVPHTLPPVVNLPPTEVTVNVPEQAAPVVNVPAAKAVDVQRVEVVTMPRRVHSVLRTKKGEVTGSVEDDA